MSWHKYSFPGLVRFSKIEKYPHYLHGDLSWLGRAVWHLICRAASSCSSSHFPTPVQPVKHLVFLHKSLDFFFCYPMQFVSLKVNISNSFYNKISEEVFFCGQLLAETNINHHLSLSQTVTPLSTLRTWKQVCTP